MDLSEEAIASDASWVVTPLHNIPIFCGDHLLLHVTQTILDLAFNVFSVLMILCGTANSVGLLS